MDNNFLPLVLASASPRRAELLTSAGFSFRISSADVDESARAGEDGPAQARRLAAAKARTVAERIAEPALVLGSDTLVLLEGQVLGKPKDPDDALRMLRLLNGRVHEVVTAVAVQRSADGRQVGGAVLTRVRFGTWDDAVLAAYAHSGTVLDKAGAYAVQEGGGALIVSIEGSVSNVIGLPLAETIAWIRELGGPPPFHRTHR